MLADYVLPVFLCTCFISLRKIAICGIIKNINFQKMRNFNGT